MTDTFTSSALRDAVAQARANSLFPAVESVLGKPMKSPSYVPANRIIVELT